MKITILIAAIVVIAGVVFWNDISGLITADKTAIQGEAAYNAKAQDEPASGAVSIKSKWDLPEELKEVSGIAWLDKDRIACVQDEEGKVFIYNRAAKNIEKQIPFAGAGDFEGLTIKGNTIFVVRADGRLFEIDMNSPGSAKEYATPLTVEHNIEGLCYDKNNDRLLLAAKDDEPGQEHKNIYAFDLKTKKLTGKPAYSIDLSHELLSKSIMPSAIGIHPLTNDIYITDGPKSRLLIMDNSGNLKKLHNLGKEFAQPEGITFSPEGDIFISNEGAKLPANIMKVTLD